MTDYPSGIDVSLVDGINFDELEKLLEEYTTNEIQTSADEKMGNAREEVMPKLVAGGVSAGFFVICLALTCLWRQGLILYVFGAKAAVLALSAIVKIITQILVHWQPIDVVAQDVVNEVVNESVNEAVDKAVNVLQDWRLLKQLLASLGCLTAGLNLMFFYELFQCTCKIELREFRVRGLIANMSLVVIASVIVCGIHELLYAVILRFYSSPSLSPIWTHVLDNVFPVHLAMIFSSTVISIFLAGRIFVAILDSKRFSIINGKFKRSHENNYLLVIVFNVGVAQALRVALLILTITASSLLVRDIVAVTEGKGFISESHGLLVAQDNFFRNVDFPGFLEFFSLLLPVMWTKVKEVFVTQMI